MYNARETDQSSDVGNARRQESLEFHWVNYTYTHKYGSNKPEFINWIQ